MTTQSPMTVPTPAPTPTHAPTIVADDPGHGVTQTKAGFHIPSLDGIRAVAFLIVFASHAITESIPGGFGVTIFFFLSGFLITTLMRLEAQKTGTIDLRKFYARRALRIFPNFYLVLLASTGLAAAGLIGTIGDDGVNLRAFLWQAFYANNYYAVFGHDYGTPKGTGVFWSLAVEEHFYFLFPAVFLVLHRRVATARGRVIALLALCGALLAWRCVITFVFEPTLAGSYSYKASDARFDSMLFGCALAVAGNPVLDRSRFGDAFWRLVATPAAVALLGVTFAVRNEHFRESLRYTLQGAALAPLFIAAIRCHRHPAFAWLNWRSVRFVGVLTYTLYLVHLVAVLRLGEWIGTGTPARRLAAAALALGLSFAIAVGVHYGIERPLAAWRKRLHAGR